MHTGFVPDQGQLKAADTLKIVSFDQNRETIDPALTLRQRPRPGWRFD